VNVISIFETTAGLTGRFGSFCFFRRTLGRDLRFPVASLFAIKTGKHIHRLLAAIIAAKRAGMMGFDRFAAFRALRERRILQKQVHPALVPASFGMSFFWYATHKNS